MRWIRACAAALSVAVPIVGCSNAGGEAAPAKADARHLACPPGFADCDGDAANGCEAALDTSALNCGACGVRCPSGAGATPLCAAGECVQICDSGRADCDGDKTNGCEVDTRTDPKACGGCGSVCEASCYKGACDVTPVAEKLAQPTFLAIDGDVLYCSDMAGLRAGAGSVIAVPKQGGPPRTVASGQSGPRQLAVDATHIYWVNQGTPPMFADGSVARVAKEVGAPETLASGQAVPWGLALAGSTLYWTVSTGVMALDLGTEGASPSVVAMARRPTDVVAVGAALYWLIPSSSPNGTPAKDGALMRLSPGGTPEALVSNLDQPVGLIADAAGAYLYWGVHSALWRAPVSGGTPELLADGLSPPPWRIAVDSAAAYWTTAADADGTVNRVSLDSKAVRVLASHQATLWDLVLDAERVFWSSVGDGSGIGSGAILSIKKP